MDEKTTENVKVMDKVSWKDRIKIKKPKFKKPNRDFVKGAIVGGLGGFTGGVLIESKLGLTDHLSDVDDYDDYDDIDSIDEPTDE